jgi:hypothetical protein
MPSGVGDYKRLCLSPASTAGEVVTICALPFSGGIILELV